MQPVASGGPQGPHVIMALGVCDWMPGLWHKENCGGRKQTVPQAHPIAPAPGTPRLTGRVPFGWMWVEHLSFLRFDFPMLICPCSRAGGRPWACPLNKAHLWDRPYDWAQGLAPHSFRPASEPLLCTGMPSLSHLHASKCCPEVRVVLAPGARGQNSK